MWCVIFLRGTVGASRGGRDGAARRRRPDVSVFQGKLADVCSGASINRGADARHVTLSRRIYRSITYSENAL